MTASNGGLVDQRKKFEASCSSHAYPITLEESVQIGAFLRGSIELVADILKDGDFLQTIINECWSVSIGAAIAFYSNRALRTQETSGASIDPASVPVTDMNWATNYLRRVVISTTSHSTIP